MNPLQTDDTALQLTAAEISEIAERFVEARRNGRALATYPGRMPKSLADAYAIQAAAIAAIDRPVLGWKVGRIPAPLIEVLGADRLAGPIFDIGELPFTPQAGVIGSGFAAVEAEFMLQIDRLPATQNPTNDDAQACIGTVRAGIEIASSPYPAINDHGPFVTISDFGANHGILLGPVIADPMPLLQQPIETLVNGISVGCGWATAMLDGPFGAARFIFELAAAGVIKVASGQWISSGAVSGVHPVRPGDQAQILFGEPPLLLDVAFKADAVTA